MMQTIGLTQPREAVSGARWHELEERQVVFRKRKELTMAEALTRQGVDVSVDPGAILLAGLEDYWAGRGKDIFVNFAKERGGKSTVKLRAGHGEAYEYVIATVNIIELAIGNHDFDRWKVYISALPGSRLSGCVHRCYSKCDLTGKIVHV